MKYIATLFILCIFSCNLYAQNEHDFKTVSFQTKDGIEISGILQYPSETEKPVPAIILIHQAGSSTQEWVESAIIYKLLKENYAVLAYDIRLHGKSGKDGDFTGFFSDPQRSPLDLLAAIEFLKQDKKIDADRMGILGASIGGNLACVAVSSDKFDIKSAVSISAKTDAVQNLSGLKETISPKNIFHIASEKEQDGKREEWANELYELSKGKRKVEIAPGDKHGSYILRENEYLDTLIIEWFKTSL